MVPLGTPPVAILYILYCVRHVHVSNHDHFTDILSAFAILELEYTACVFILFYFYLLVMKDNDPTVKI